MCTFTLLVNKYVVNSRYVVTDSDRHSISLCSIFQDTYLATVIAYAVVSQPRKIKD